MKTEELKSQGLTEEQISFVMAENGKDLKKLQKENDNLSADRDTWKEKAEAAETTLKGFEGVDLETMQKELSDWKQKATEAEKKAQEQIYERDFADALKTEFEGIEFSSEAAKRAIMAEVKEAGLKLKDGKILGLNDLISQMKEKDASAFIDEGQQKAQQNAARFTQPFQRQNQSGGITKDQIMGIKDASERQSAIAANIHLFGKGE
ncbi:phage scaffolding protein [Anaerotignum lactatifermentans]|uniref:phage scaffolding protein n=1 Tax=Anaerotignum lactatifermentans TaxID=160404 RepID=UPI003AB2B025